MNSLCTSADSFNRTPRLPKTPKPPRDTLAHLPSRGVASPHVTFPLRIALFIARVALFVIRDTIGIRASRSRGHFDA